MQNVLGTMGETVTEEMTNAMKAMEAASKAFEESLTDMQKKLFFAYKETSADLSYAEYKAAFFEGMAQGGSQCQTSMMIH